MENMDTILELLRLAGVGVIAGLFSALIANRGHRSKKWWELRVASYQAVIEALSDLNHYFDRKYKAVIENRELTEEYQVELKRIWDESYHKVRKAADSGVFLFSEDVNAALKEFIDLKDTHFDSYFEYLDNNLAVAENCLKTVVASANKDLRVRGKWL